MGGIRRRRVTEEEAASDFEEHPHGKMLVFTGWGESPPTFTHIA